jgi:uncharacterized membrane protein (DUF2068 family)
MEKVHNRYELLSCAFRGHELVGVGAASLTDADPAIARELGGLRWHRCLRCDAWVPSGSPESPTGEGVPTRDDIEVPMRGPRLRDRYVLRLIAIDRALHVVVLLAVVVTVLVFVNNRSALDRDYQELMNAISGSRPDGLHGFFGHFRRFFVISPAHLYEVAIAAGVYAVLEAVEAVGLWYAKRWAEYLTFVATVALIPLEVDEMIRKFSSLKLTLFIVNVAIALYLLYAKRLFGLRGGEKALEKYRTEREGWVAVDAATVDPVAATPSG